MKKITLIALLLLTLTVSVQAISFNDIKKITKLVTYSQSKKIWTSNKKMLETLSSRNEEIKSFNSYMQKKYGKNFKPKKLYKKKDFIKLVYATAKMFEEFPKRVIWYETIGSKGQKRLLGFSRKTGMVVIFNNQMKVVTSYTSNVSKLTRRCKDNKITFLKKKDAIETIKLYQSNRWYKKLLMSEALYVSGGLFF